MIPTRSLVLIQKRLLLSVVYHIQVHYITSGLIQLRFDISLVFEIGFKFVNPLVVHLSFLENLDLVALQLPFNRVAESF